MGNISEDYGRDLDLNLLRVFVVVAQTQSVTQAAARLYLTQPAVSAAMRRLSDAVGTPLLARSGRGVVLTERGERLLALVAPRLEELVRATLSPPEFDPRTTERTLRVGLSDVMEGWLLPRLLRTLERRAPNMRLISLPVQFRTVAEALSTRRIDMAVTVADELPSQIRRQALLHTGFVCLFDPRHARVGKRLSEARYFEHEHVIVSYNGDLRGVVEDLLHKQRQVRCSVSSFGQIGAVVEGSALLATVPEVVARYVLQSSPRLRTTRLPFEVVGSALELFWPAATDDDEACRFLRKSIVDVTDEVRRENPSWRAAPAASAR